MADPRFDFDLAPILDAINTADVLVVRFPVIASRLLVDARWDGADPPVIALVPQASGIEERFRTVRQARPRQPVPERIISFQWPRQAETLKAAGVWERIVARLTASGVPGIERRCEDAFRALLVEERREAAAAIRGADRYQTVWQRESA
jgi:hypothetical protein